MNYRVKATRTVYKYIDIEANSDVEALEKAEKMAGEGEISFDDEPFLKMETNVEVL